MINLLNRQSKPEIVQMRINKLINQLECEIEKLKTLRSYEPPKHVMNATDDYDQPVSLKNVIEDLFI